jgi:hypothetical protein
MLIIYNTANPLISAMGDDGFHGLFWVITALLVVAFIILAIVYRQPREGEASPTLNKKVPLREALPHLLKPKLIALGLCWLCAMAINQCVTNYIVTFMQDGYNMSQPVAALLGSVASAAGIAAVIYGFIYDRVKLDRKYLTIVVAAGSLLLAMLLGFKPADLSSPLGMCQFVAYLVFMFIGNAGLIATIRPYVPLLVGKGGVTAIGYGIAAVTLLQYIGQMFQQVWAMIVDAIAGPTVAAAASAASKGGAAVDPSVLAQYGNAFGVASWILVGIAAIGFIASLFLRVKAQKEGERK